MSNYNNELRKEIDNAVQKLIMRDATMAHSNFEHAFGCAPVRDFYISFISKHYLPLLKTVWGFIPYEDYPNPNTEHALNSPEIGCIGPVRFFSIPLVPQNKEIIIQAFDENFICVDSEKIKLNGFQL